MKACRSCRMEFVEGFSIGQRMACPECSLPFVSSRLKVGGCEVSRQYVRPGMEWKTLYDPALRHHWMDPLSEEELA